MTFLESKLIEHIECELFTETTSDRIKKYPNGDKRIDFSVSGEKPYGIDKLNIAMTKNPWFGCDYHIKDNLDARKTADIINGYVKENDHFIILGDMEDHDDPDIDVVSEFVKSIKCKNKYLVLGNNDSFPLDEYKKMGFLTATDTYSYDNLVIAHFPMNVDDGHICIHGHLHGCAKDDPRKYWFCDPTKCIDVWDDNYIPQRLDSLLKKFNRWHNESVIEESVSITYSSSKEDVIEIIETLSIKERSYIASKNYDKKSFPQIFVSKTKNLIYREVIKINDIPAGFIDIYSFNKNEGFIVLAIRSEDKYRHKGYGKILVNRAINSMRSSNVINKLIWEFDNDNTKSAYMADSLGFSGTGNIREMILEEVIEESVSKIYYRFAYNNEGIYEALKRKVGLNTWKSLLSNPAINWLPKPASYFTGYASYFTQKGYDIFTEKTLPIMEKYLSKNNIKLEVFNEKDIGYICYSDEYQVCTTDESGITLLNITKFNYDMNNMKYQLKNKNYQLDNITDESDYDKYYRVLSPQDFIKYGGGTCWDYVIYQAYYFKRYYPGIKFYTFYHQSVHEDPNDAPSHTFMIFTVNNKWYWFESAWKINIGIWEFNTLEDALNFITDLLITSAENEPGISIYKDHFLVSYNPLNSNMYDMTCTQFMNTMVSLPEFKYKNIKLVKNYKRYVDKDQYKNINGIEFTESCKDLMDARKLVQEVQKISKKHNANFFFVTDGASGYSNGNGENNPAVKAMRQSMDEWETKNSFNPDDDWSNNPTDTSGYRMEEVIEENTNSFGLYQEEANFNKRNIYPVFIVLTQTDGIFAKATKLTTNSDWSHATIAFNPELNPYYSFGCKSLKPLKFGLMTNGEDAFHDTDKAKYAIYVMYVNKSQYKKLQIKMQYYIDNKDNLGYSWIGLPRLLLKLPHDYGDKYFCSQFVMTLIGEIMSLPKDPSLWSPGDIEYLDNISKVCSGEDLREYDPKVVIKNLEYVKQKQFGKIKLESADDSFLKYMKGIIN